jgi:putative ATP-binding cassette transporter
MAAIVLPCASIRLELTMANLAEYRETAKQLYRILKPFQTSKNRWIVATIFAVSIVLTFASSEINCGIGKVSGHVISAIQKQDNATLRSELVYMLELPFMLMLSQAGGDFLRTKIALDLYEWLSLHALQKVIKGDIASKLRSDIRIDNPGQILTQELESLINTAIGLGSAIITAVVDLIVFSMQLCGIVYLLPVVAIGWALLGTIGGIVIACPLVALNKRKSKTDATLRQVIERASDPDTEAPKELECAQKALAKKMIVCRRLMYANRNVSLAVIPFNQLTPVIGMLVITWIFVPSMMEIGVVTTAIFAFGKAVNSLTIVVQQIAGFTSLAASVQRVGVLWDVIDEYNAVKTRELLEKKGNETE